MRQDFEDRIAERRYLKKFQWHLKQIQATPTKPLIFFSNGLLFKGQEPKHRIKAARLMRVAQRLKYLGLP